MAAQQMAAMRVAALQAAALQMALLQMAAWWASLAVLPAPVAVRQVHVRSDLGAPVVEGQLVASPEGSTGLGMAKAMAVWVAKAKAVSLD